MGHLPEYLSRARIVLDCVLVTLFSVVLGTWYKWGETRSFFLQAAESGKQRGEGSRLDRHKEGGGGRKQGR